MKRILSLALAFLCLFGLLPCAHGSELATATDYSVAGKLLRQLWAGSGFSGTLLVEIAAKEGVVGQVITQKPIEFGVDYIYVRPDTIHTAEHRADISLMENGEARTAAHLQFKEGLLAVQADVVGEECYTFNGGVVRVSAAGTAATPGTDAAAPEAVATPPSTDAVAPNASATPGTDAVAPDTSATPNADAADASAAAPSDESALAGVRATASELLRQTGMPSLLGFVLPMLLSMEEQGTDYTDVVDTYTTRIDLWIEGYRQNAVLGKLADGTNTMDVQYEIEPAAIKAQLKQMVLDLLYDANALKKLQTLLSAEDADLLLNPKLQSYYFAAIDALPLTGNLTIARTVTLKGDTLALHLALPMYDSQSGNLTLRYDRVQGEGDLPEESTLSVESETRNIALTYLEYASMTGVTVWQGSLKSEPRGVGSFAVSAEGDADVPQKALAATFTFTRETVTGTDEEGRETLDYNASLTVAPDAASSAAQAGGAEFISFPATEIALKTRFASKALKTASTEMNATLTLGGEDWNQLLTLTFSGKSRKKWDPSPMAEERVSVSTMPRAQLEALLPGVATRAGLIFLPYLGVSDGTQAAPAQEAPTAEPETSPGASPETSPGASPETSPEATPAALPEAASEVSPNASLETSPEALAETSPEASPEPSPDATPEAANSGAPTVSPDASSDASPEPTTDLTPIPSPTATP